MGINTVYRILMFRDLPIHLMEEFFYWYIKNYILYYQRVLQWCIKTLVKTETIIHYQTLRQLQQLKLSSLNCHERVFSFTGHNSVSKRHLQQLKLSFISCVDKFISITRMNNRKFLTMYLTYNLSIFFNDLARKAISHSPYSKKKFSISKQD